MRAGNSPIEDQQRDVTTFLTKFTVEFPVANGRLFPYLTGGGGVGRVRERFSIVVDPIPWIPLDPLGAGPVEHPSDGINTMRFFDSSIFPSPVEYSELGLSLLGGGVDVQLWRGLAVGVDVRWLRILRSYDAFDTAQVTSRGELSVLSWRDSLQTEIPDRWGCPGRVVKVSPSTSTTGMRASSVAARAACASCDRLPSVTEYLPQAAERHRVVTAPQSVSENVIHLV